MGEIGQISLFELLRLVGGVLGTVKSVSDGFRRRRRRGTYCVYPTNQPWNKCIALKGMGKEVGGDLCSFSAADFYQSSTMSTADQTFSRNRSHPGRFGGEEVQARFFPFGLREKGREKRKKEEVSLQDRLQAQSASLYLGKARQLEYCRRWNPPSFSFSSWYTVHTRHGRRGEGGTGTSYVLPPKTSPPCQCRRRKSTLLPSFSLLPFCVFLK